jgi:tRNA (guanine-N7-)-methyltransferase
METTDIKSNFINFYGRRVSHLSDSNKLIFKDIFPKYEVKENYFLEEEFLNLKNKYSEINLEIGFGSGDFLFHSAKSKPNTFFLGIEVFINGVVAILRKLKDNKLDNIKIYNNNLYLILDKLPPNFFNNIYILFPDPWHKKKHNKRRLINQDNLNIFYNILKPKGLLRFVSDDADYVSHTMEHFLNDDGWKWLANSVEDFKNPPDDHIITKYQQKAINKGSAVSYLHYKKI